MKNRKKKRFNKLLVLPLSISIALGATAFAIAGSDSADVSLAGSTLSATDNTASAVMVLRVSGGSLEEPLEYRSDSGSVSMSVGGLADGLYNYEILLLTPAANEGESGSLERQSGSFSVSNGAVVEKTQQAPAENATNATDGVSKTERSIYEKVAISILDFVFSSAEAADLVSDNTVTPRVYLRQNGVNSWQFLSSNFGGINDDALGIFNHLGVRYVMSFKKDTTFNVDHGVDNYTINTGTSGGTGLTGIAPIYLQINKAAANSFIANSSGDISLADGSAFLDKSTDSLGLGTTTPSSELHIVDTSPQIRLDNGAEYFSHEGGGDYEFKFNDGTTTTRIMTVENNDSACDREDAPCIGYFLEANPDASVHYRKNDGKMRILIEEDGTNDTTPTKNRTLLRLINNGGPNMSFQDSSNGIGWQFAQTTAGDFAISKELSGGSELIVQGDGRVRMGPGPVTNFDLRNNGDLLIPNGVIKVGGTTLNVPDYVFEKDYKLMPLDELQVFIGKNKHLPNVPSESDIKKAKLLDLGGTSMTHLEKIEELTLYTLQQHKQIKALQRDNTQLNKKLSDQTMALKSENDVLKQRLASLEKLVTNIASSGKTLSATGKKVAFKLSQ